MRYITILLTILLFLLVSCSTSGQLLQELAHKAYSQKTWEPPLPPKKFKTDGCSWWPDDDWGDCCVAHDLTYWMGGTRKNRKKADIALKNCVEDKDHPVISEFMYYGVRVFGVYWLPTPFRWGFGWNYPHSGPHTKQIEE